jgi:ribosomal protein S20
MVIAGKVKDAKKQLNIVFKKLDKAAKINVIKKNKSSRLKSRLSKLLNKNTK